MKSIEKMDEQSLNQLVAQVATRRVEYEEFRTRIHDIGGLGAFVTMVKSVRGNFGGRRIRTLVKMFLSDISEDMFIDYLADKSQHKYIQLRTMFQLFHPKPRNESLSRAIMGIMTPYDVDMLNKLSTFFKINNFISEKQVGLML